MFPERMLGPIAGVFSQPAAYVSAWANVDGDATPAALRQSYGVASLTDNGTGDYSLTWSVGRRAAGYAVLATTQSNGGISVRHVAIHSTGGLTATTGRFFTSTGTTAVDQDQFTVILVGL